jgi:hypothetical protein
VVCSSDFLGDASPFSTLSDPGGFWAVESAGNGRSPLQSPPVIAKRPPRFEVLSSGSATEPCTVEDANGVCVVESVGNDGSPLLLRWLEALYFLSSVSLTRFGESDDSSAARTMPV